MLQIYTLKKERKPCPRQAPLPGRLERTRYRRPVRKSIGQTRDRSVRARVRGPARPGPAYSHSRRATHQSEGKLQLGVGTSLLHVVTGDGNGIVLGHVVGLDTSKNT